jgi:hypothetical protein
VTEALLQQQVTDLARWAGYLCYHTVDSRRSRPGFPDLVLVHTRNGRLIFAELKSEKGRIRPEQQVWLEHLGHHHEVYLWRPQHWESGVIRRVLTAETRRGAA